MRVGVEEWGCHCQEDSKTKKQSEISYQCLTLDRPNWKTEDWGVYYSIFMLLIKHTKNWAIYKRKRFNELNIPHVWGGLTIMVEGKEE